MPTIETPAYARHKVRTAARQRQISESGREIWPLPAPKNPQRRRAGLLSLKTFCETYLADDFFLEWSPAHLEFIEWLETAILYGTKKAQAMPRGTGKTTLCQASGLWAILGGHRKFVVLVGATATKAGEMLEYIKDQLETNELLGEDFPDTVGVIQSLGGIYQSTPLYLGKPVKVRMKGNLIRFPQIPGAVGAGAVLYADGILGKGLRGLKKRRKGESLRPDIVLIDDPQDDESAIQPRQNEKRLRIINGTILGLAGPKVSLTVLAGITVIAQNDLADRLLDRSQNPSWQGTRVGFLSAVPESPLWDEYFAMRSACQRMGDVTFKEATEFYLAHRAEMDGNVVPMWNGYFKDGSVSAIQFAMNVIQDRGRAAFYAEYQNTPLSSGGDVQWLKVDDLREKLNGIKRGVVPDWSSVLVFDIDVQDNILLWLVKAGGPNGDRAVIDYGFYPEQNRRHFAVREVKMTLKKRLSLKKRAKSGGFIGDDGADTAGTAFAVSREEAMYDGLIELSNLLCGRDWRRENGGAMPIRLGTIDAQDGDHWRIVYQVCRESPYRHLLMPRHGVPVKASDRPLSITTKKDNGVTIGEEWVRGPCKKEYGRQDRLLVDANYWKSQSQARWLTGRGANGCATLFGRDFDEHGMFADHRTSEYPNRITAEGKYGRRVADEWVLFPGRTENHFLDLDVATDVALSVCGIGVLAETEPVNRARRRVTREQFYGQR